MTYEQDMVVRQKCWYRDGVEAGRKEGMATQKAEDEKIIQEKEFKLQEQAAELQKQASEIARILEENARMKALIENK